MNKPKLIRITTVPQSLKILLKGQLAFMNSNFEVIGISSPGEFLEEVKDQEGIRVVPVSMTRTISPFTDLKSLWNLYRVIKKDKPTIVHTHTPKAGLLGMIASWLARVPVRMHTVAGLPLVEATGFKRKILIFVEKLTYRFATKVYPNSKGQYDFIIKEKLLPIQKLKIIGNGSSNGINTNYFSPEFYSKENNLFHRKKYDISKEDFVFIFIGRLVKDKGINELIKAFTNLSKTYTNTTLLLVGKYENNLDPLNSETVKQIETHSKIVFAGYQKDVRPFFAMSNCLVFPSYREGFPNVVMQAGAMGLPSIVTDINGCNEIVEEGVNGTIIPTKNTEKLQEKMEEFILNPERVKQLAASSRNRITEKYKREHIWEALLEEYNLLLKDLV